MRRTRLMTLLLILLCGAVVYAWMATPRQRRITEAGAGRTVQTGRVVQQAEATYEIEDFDFSGGTGPVYKKPKKNLFAALYPPPKATVKRRPTVVKPKPVKPKPVQVISSPVVQVSQPQPMPQFKILGFLNKGGEYTVFLASKQGEIYLVHQGDDFASDLSVHDISATEITLIREKTGQKMKMNIGKAENQRLPNLKITSGRPRFTAQKKTAEGQSGASSVNSGSPFPTPKSTVNPAKTNNKANNFIGN